MGEAPTIRELQEATPELFHAAGKARKPTRITDRGKSVAVQAAPEVVVAQRRQPRRILPEYEVLMRCVALRKFTFRQPQTVAAGD